MAKITEITKQKKNVKRYNIYIDGNFCCGLDDFTIIKRGLKVGTEIETEEIVAFAFESELNLAFNKAANLLAKSLKTEKQLVEYLKGKGYPKAVVDEVVSKLKEYKYIGDEEYSKAYLSSHETSCGARKIKYELKAKGVSDKIIDTIEIPYQSERETALRLSEKFMRNREHNIKEVVKLVRHLASKGFDYEIINVVKGKYLNNDFEVFDD